MLKLQLNHHKNIHSSSFLQKSNHMFEFVVMLVFLSNVENFPPLALKSTFLNLIKTIYYINKNMCLNVYVLPIRSIHFFAKWNVYISSKSLKQKKSSVNFWYKSLLEKNAMNIIRDSRFPAKWNVFLMDIAQG